MTERTLKNTWVEIGAVVLQKDERAPNLPIIPNRSLWKCG
jgi:hypothetical protein